jgi:hypothetical protein
MVLTNDLLLGLLGGVVLTLIIQQLMRVSSRVLRPGCLLVLGLGAGLVVLLAVTGVIQVQFLSPP